MKITNILVNHMHEPVGFDLSHLLVEFSIESSDANIEKRLIISTNDVVVYETEFEAYDNNKFSPDFVLEPRTKYNVAVEIKANGEVVSESTFFETGKLNESWTAEWIAHPEKNLQNTIFKKEIDLKGSVKNARLYMTGLGVYETYLNGEKISDEILAPGTTDYGKWIQIQTYDVTDALQLGKTSWTVSTADGWYKGVFGFIEGLDKHYGDHHRIIAELHIEYTDGNKEIVVTDSSWEATSGQITRSSIYYGEDFDANIEHTNWENVVALDEPKNVLSDRMSPILRIQERLDVVEVINTPVGEVVLDFGQNHAGLFEFYNREPKGTVIKLEAGEHMIDGNFYRENLRQARAAFEFISDGVERWIRPHFTYFGYRYVRVSGNTLPINPDDFKSGVLYSDMTFTGSIETENEKVNRLFENVKWGQKSNFVDVPTDCPQRDERLGWTGDANVFSNTAALNANVYQFFRKFAKDMAVEQSVLKGMTPMYVPSFGNTEGGAAVWGDATTVIPWNLYQHYGDDAILKQHYSSMKAWIDWITRNTKTPYLWTGGFQFGDWIALDGENPAMPTGKTDEDFIASVYYYYSSEIVSKVASILGHADDANYYGNLSKGIKEKVAQEYITQTGRLSIDTQTAYALALFFNLIPESQIKRVLNDLVNRLSKDNNHLKTGFVGTPLINQVLSKFGQHQLAMKILMHEDYPSWLYAVNKGATTVWERWNSVQEDDTMHPDGMNSLNHYSIGAVMEWAYRYILGVKSVAPGAQVVEWSPLFDYRLKKVKGHVGSSYGKLEVSYQIELNDNHLIEATLVVPYGQTVKVKLPRAIGTKVKVNENRYETSEFSLEVGTYKISYIPTENYIEHYSMNTTVREIMADDELVSKIDTITDALNFFKADPESITGGLGGMTLAKVNSILPFITINDDEMSKIHEVLVQTPLLSERN